jgi:signal transduction histidine kinase
VIKGDVTDSLDREAPPAQTAFLTFTDPALEDAYLQREYETHRKVIGLNLVFTVAVLAVFAVLDPLLVPPQLLDEFRAVRLGVLVPLVALSLVPIRLITQARSWNLAGSILLLLFGLCWTWLLLIGGEAVLGYLSLAMVQTIAGAFFLLGLPILLSLPVVLAFCLVFVICAFDATTSNAVALTYGLGCLTVTVIAAFGAFRTEKVSRQQFIAQALSEAQHAKRLAIQADRNRWLEVIAAFLRHELRNSMVGASTSIELAARAPDGERMAEFLDRGRRSLQFMRRLLAQVADATSLEAALAVQELEALDLSELVSGRVHDLRLADPEWTVHDRIESGQWIRGNPDSLAQMLDKLLDNAIEHGDRQYPLVIELVGDGADALVTIANRGEPLPEDIERLFQPFVSNKSSAGGGGGNLGLGLFVARAIAMSHGGNVTARALDAPPGASFAVRLPRCAMPSARQPAVAAPALGDDPVE